MQGKTHKKGGMLCALVGFLLLKINGLLLQQVSDWIQLIIIYPFAMWGSVLSDTDHHWESCPDKGIPNYIINKLLHITTPLYKRLDKSLSGREKKDNFTYQFAKLFSANHRSWQTHSDLTLVVLLFLLWSTLHGSILGHKLLGGDSLILSLVFVGICIGIIAHFILDMLTPQGVWFTVGVLLNKFVFKKHVLPEKLRVVPKSKVFRTGSAWEDFVGKVVTKATVVASIIVIIALARPELFQTIVDFILGFSSSFEITIK